jgi:chemotaxis protein MotA
MFQIIGIVLLFGLVFGSYLISGGNLGVILHAAAPRNDGHRRRGRRLLPDRQLDAGDQGHGLGGLGRVFGGNKWKAADYRDLLALLFLLTKTMKSKGVIALESHIENPKDSTIFSRFPKIMKDHFAVDFICDTLRMMTMNLEDPAPGRGRHGKAAREAPPREPSGPSHALQSLADALPALGIVAAVLGVIKTMGAITEPPEVLGEMIGSRPGRHLHRGLPGLWPGRSHGHAHDAGQRRGWRLLPHHPVGARGPSPRQRCADFGRDRPRQCPFRRPAQLPRTRRGSGGHSARGLSLPAPGVITGP